MNYTIENEVLRLSFRSCGAELTSIFNKSSKLEYLWNGDSAYWSYHAPILFPFIGKSMNNQYRAEGKTFPIKQHGFARTNEFNLLQANKNSISFELTYNNELLDIYPYKFSLIISYTLVGNKIDILYTVNNLDIKPIYYSIGAHPAFMCPLLAGESLGDYYLEFNKDEALKQMPVTKDGYFSRDTIDFPITSTHIPLCFELFKADALVFKNLKSDEISIRSLHHQHGITLKFSQFPYLGIWTKYPNAPFICIEPWRGHADYMDFKGDITEKEGVNLLPIGNTSSCKYSVKVF